MLATGDACCHRSKQSPRQRSPAQAGIRDKVNFLKNCFGIVVGLLVVVTQLRGTFARADESVRVSATIRVGGGGDDRLDGVAIAADGSIYVVGTLSDRSPLRQKPELALPSHHGNGKDTDGRFAVGFVARFDRGGTLQSSATLPPGVGELNAVAVDRSGNVFVGGFATSGLQTAIRDAPGLHRAFPAERMTPQRHTPRDHTEPRNPQPDLSPRAAPIVLKFDPTLSKLLAGTYLEGRQTVWHVPAPLDEPMSQPTGIVPLNDGDVLVCHDGGPIVPPEPGQQPGAFHFYYAEDRVSRLSSNLDQRRWQVEVRMPPIDPERASRALGQPWKHDTMGNTRTLRFRSDARDGALLAGCAPSRTSAEPWWAPFLLRVDGSGKVSVVAYTFDPTGGGEARLGGLVSDSAIRSVRAGDDGSLLVTTLGDGGNSVLRRDPRDYTREAPKLKGSAHGFRGRTLFWGTVVRLDGRSGELLAGNTVIGYHRNVAEPAWAEDALGLPDGSVVAVGRHRRGFPLRDAGHPFFEKTRRPPDVDARSPPPVAYQVLRDAWGGFIATYDREMNPIFVGSVDGAAFREVAPSADGRFLAVVGTAEAGRGEAKDATRLGMGGKVDGLLLLIDVARR